VINVGRLLHEFYIHNFISEGLIATCWAALVHFGRDGYVKSTKAIIDIAKHVEQKHVS
jgi:hypothetical protein